MQMIYEINEFNPDDDTNSKKLNILFFADDNHHNSNVRNDIFQFVNFSKHNYTIYNPLADKQGSGWRAKIRRKQVLTPWKYDVVLIHFSIYILGEYFLPKYVEKFLIKFKGLVIQTIRDEYRSIFRMNAKQSKLGVDILLSVLKREDISKVYFNTAVKNITKISCLPGYGDLELAKMFVPSIKDRPVTISYRSRELPPELGSFARLKIDLGKNMKAILKNSSVIHDIEVNESSRLYGKDWINLHTRSKAVLSAPGGVSIFDFDDSAKRLADMYTERNPDSTPEEVIEQALSSFDNKIIHAQLTPRTFEAIALRTALVMPISHYRNILRPNEHYIPIEVDMSNIEEVLEKLNNDDLLQKMANRTYNYIFEDLKLTRKSFVERFDGMLKFFMCERNINV